MSKNRKTNFTIGILIVTLIASACMVFYTSFYKKTASAAPVFNSKEFYGEDDVNKTILNVEKGIVMITSEDKYSTGIILNDKGYILTTEHLDKNTHKVFHKDGAEINFEEVPSKDSNNLGLYLIKVDPKYTTSFLALGNSSELKKGQEIYSISNLFGYFGSVTHGIIATTNTSVGNFNDLILTDAVAQDGSLGGAIFDDTEKVLGVILDYYVDHDTNRNSGLTIVLPVNKVKTFLKDNSVNYIE